VVGCPPVVRSRERRSLTPGVDERTVAGGLAGRAITVERGSTVDILCRRKAEWCVEGYVDGLSDPRGVRGVPGYVGPRTTTSS